MKREVSNSKALDDNKLERVSGGWTDWNRGTSYQMRYHFTPEEARKLRGMGYGIRARVEYTRSDLKKILGLKAGSRNDIADWLDDKGFRYEGLESWGGDRQRDDGNI